MDRKADSSIAPKTFILRGYKNNYCTFNVKNPVSSKTWVVLLASKGPNWVFAGIISFAITPIVPILLSDTSKLLGKVNLALYETGIHVNNYEQNQCHRITFCKTPFSKLLSMSVESLSMRVESRTL